MTRRRCGPSMPLVDATGESEEPSRCRTRLPGQSPRSGHTLLQIGGKVAVRADGRAFGSPAGPSPVGQARRREYGGRAMRLRLGVHDCLLSCRSLETQAKGGGACWAARRRAGPGTSASRPDRGSTKDCNCTCWPKPHDARPCTRRPATCAAGRAASTAGRSTSTATAVPGARHRAASGEAQPAVAGQWDDEERHCSGSGWCVGLLGCRGNWLRADIQVGGFAEQGVRWSPR